eukprot:2777837-Amphidinium_carterae.1
MCVSTAHRQLQGLGLAAGFAVDSAAAYASGVKQELYNIASRGTVEGFVDIVFVTGNDAGDLDSIVSALAVAYGYSQTGLVSGQHDGPTLFMPMVNIPRDEFRLRGDARLAFKKSGIDMDPAGAPTCYLFFEEVMALKPQLEKALRRPC